MLTSMITPNCPFSIRPQPRHTHPRQRTSPSPEFHSSLSSFSLLPSSSLFSNFSPGPGCSSSSSLPSYLFPPETGNTDFIFIPSRLDPGETSPDTLLCSVFPEQDRKITKSILYTPSCRDPMSATLGARHGLQSFLRNFQHPRVSNSPSPVRKSLRSPQVPTMQLQSFRRSLSWGRSDRDAWSPENDLFPDRDRPRGRPRGRGRPGRSGGDRRSDFPGEGGGERSGRGWRRPGKQRKDSDREHIWGVHSVHAALRAKHRRLDHLFLQDGVLAGRSGHQTDLIHSIHYMAQEAGIPISTLGRVP